MYVLSAWRCCCQSQTNHTEELVRKPGAHFCRGLNAFVPSKPPRAYNRSKSSALIRPRAVFTCEAALQHPRGGPCGHWHPGIAGVQQQIDFWPRSLPMGQYEEGAKRGRLTQQENQPQAVSDRPLAARPQSRACQPSGQPQFYRISFTGELGRSCWQKDDPAKRLPSPKHSMSQHELQAGAVELRQSRGYRHSISDSNQDRKRIYEPGLKTHTYAVASIDAGTVSVFVGLDRSRLFSSAVKAQNEDLSGATCCPVAFCNTHSYNGRSKWGPSFPNPLLWKGTHAEVPL